MDLKELLAFMMKSAASDLHLKAMRPPLLRIQGRLVPLKGNPLSREEVEAMLNGILSPAQLKKLEDRQAIDLGYGVPGVARFRCSIFQQRGTMAAVFRAIPFNVKSVEELELPDVLSTLTEFPSGMVLLTGPTGSGKSTTIAALIQRIMAGRPCHIVTIEDPIEFLFQDSVASISQREVGTDTPGFAEALRNCMRQDPDVIMIGEMRDLETVTTGMAAAETGHLVFSTLHTNSAAQTIDRIVDMYPAGQQAQVRSQLALSLRAIVSMRLLKRHRKPGRVAAAEIMINSPSISAKIEHGEVKAILEEMENSVAYHHMQSLNQSLIALLAHGEIDFAAAVQASPDAEDLSFKLRKIFPSIEEKFQEGNMAPSPADFSEITRLLETQRLYAETQEKHLDEGAQRDEYISHLEADLAEVRRSEDDLRKQLEKARADLQRATDEATMKVASLNTRIKDLSDRLAAANAAKPPASGGGLFKR